MDCEVTVSASDATTFTFSAFSFAAQVTRSPFEVDPHKLVDHEVDEEKLEEVCFVQRHCGVVHVREVLVVDVLIRLNRLQVQYVIELKKQVEPDAGDDHEEEDE